MVLDDTRWCVCCGPESVPPRSQAKYLMQKKGEVDTAACASNPIIWVHCLNTECKSPLQQKFTCFMEFLGIIQDSKYVSRRLFQSDLFLKNAIPLYQRYRNGTFPSSDIYLPHCMGCSLSALIDVGTKVTIQNVPRPLPLPPSGTISESILNDMISSTILSEPDDDFALWWHLS